jgi:ankyrin repeat protein
LYWAARFGYAETVEILLRAGAEVNVKDQDGLTGLYWAARFGFPGVIETLLDARAEVDVKDKDGLTGLYWAALFGFAEIVENLLSAGAEVNIRDKEGLAALDRAQRHGYGEVVKKFSDSGAEVNTGRQDKATSQSSIDYSTEQSPRSNVAVEMIPESSGESLDFRSDIQMPYSSGFKASWNRVRLPVVLIVAV